MFCREVKRQIGEGTGERDPEVAAHIRECPSCARTAEAQQVMENGFKAAKEKNSGPVMSLAAVRERVEVMEARETEKTRMEKIMSQIRNQYHTRPRLLTGLGVAVVVFLFITLVPFSYSHTVGYQVTINGLGPELQVSPDQLTVAFCAAGYEDISVSSSIGGSSGDYTFANLPSERAAHELASAFITLTGIQQTPKIEPVVESTSGSLFAQVRKIVQPEKRKPVKMGFDTGKIIINGDAIHSALYFTKMSDRQIEAELRKVFVKHGIADDEISISVKTDSGGSTRTVVIELENGDASAADEAAIELYLGTKEIWVRFDDDKDAEPFKHAKNLVRFEEKEQAKALDRVIEMEFPGQTLKGRTVIMKIELRPRVVLRNP